MERENPQASYKYKQKDGLLSYFKNMPNRGRVVVYALGATSVIVLAHYSFVATQKEMQMNDAYEVAEFIRRESEKKQLADTVR